MSDPELHNALNHSSQNDPDEKVRRKVEGILGAGPEIRVLTYTPLQYVNRM